MAFNGTKHFPKQDIVKFMESIGMRFGAHVNAYTSFDETVYMLQVPTDKPDVLDKAFQILEDWAHNVSFDDRRDRQGARRRHGGVAARPRRRRSGCTTSSFRCCSRTRATRSVCRSASPTSSRTPRHERLTAFYHGLVPARPDGGRRRRRLRQAGDRSARSSSISDRFASARTRSRARAIPCPTIRARCYAIATDKELPTSRASMSV